MAKITYGKLKLQEKSQPIEREWEGNIIEVKEYLPMEELIELVQDIVNSSVDENGYYNPMRINVFLTVKTFFAYTNISITEKQMENIFKVYDALKVSEIYQIVPTSAYREVHGYVSELIRSIYEYKNSVYGILDGISEDYSNLDLDIENLQNKISNPENLTLLKDVLTKLG